MPAERQAPLSGGRPLSGPTLDDAIVDAIAQAAGLWKRSSYFWADGYAIVDTEEGEVVWRQERQQRSEAGGPGFSSPAAKKIPSGGARDP